MFIAMNRFRVKRGAEGPFEKVWLGRDSYLDRVPGFVAFHLLKGPEAEDHTLYASHTVWKSKAAFEAWTKSEEFRAAHARRQRCDRATLSGASQIRGLRGTTDGNSQGGGCVTRFRPLRLASAIARSSSRVDIKHDRNCNFSAEQNDHHNQGRGPASPLSKQKSAT
jgi:heme-degrading monooxygenase HmoA